MWDLARRRYLVSFDVFWGKQKLTYAVSQVTLCVLGGKRKRRNPQGVVKPPEQNDNLFNISPRETEVTHPPDAERMDCVSSTLH
jgi:hypothetical protein